VPLSGVAYEKVRSIPTSLFAPDPAPKWRANFRIAPEFGVVGEHAREEVR